MHTLHFANEKVSNVFNKAFSFVLQFWLECLDKVSGSPEKSNHFIHLNIHFYSTLYFSWSGVAPLDSCKWRKREKLAPIVEMIDSTYCPYPLQLLSCSNEYTDWIARASGKTHIFILNAWAASAFSRFFFYHSFDRAAWMEQVMRILEAV